MIRRVLLWFGLLRVSEVEVLVQIAAEQAYIIGMRHERTRQDKPGMTLEQRNAWEMPPDVYPKPTPYKSTRN